ncbi:hypothetical protein [Streptomyces europaeiscabiei]|uniref:hypothetical protein n=1 Tax=Streptomyces europaeiscabiei TaxID=146819 RepID=UPI002E0FE395|nr:hypothetical protein OHB30_49270 [Streptomyces europaeiscabiei]
MTGSWRRLVFANPNVPHGLVDKAAYSFCVLEHLHRSLRRRDVFAKDGDRWGDPRAKLLAGEKWTAAKPKVLTALGLQSEPAGHLAELASALHAAYVQVAAGLPGNTALEVVGGKLKLGKLGKAEEPKLMTDWWRSRSSARMAARTMTGRWPGSPARLPAGGLSHPNIVTVHDFGSAMHDGRLYAYLVMELLRKVAARVDCRPGGDSRVVGLVRTQHEAGLKPPPAGRLRRAKSFISHTASL